MNASSGLRVPPGRAGRLWLRGRLQIAERGLDLLDRKLRILRGEQDRLALLAQRTGDDFQRACRDAETWLLRAALLGGQRAIRLATDSPPADVTIAWRDTMGIRYPAEATCNSSPAALEAARAAIELAVRFGARIRAVNVLRDHVLSDELERLGYRHVGERRGVAAAGVLGRVAALARAAGVEAETCQLEGEPARGILAEARGWPADLIVIAKSSQQRRAGEPYVGGETANVLEFAEQPVLVVPPRQPAGNA